MSAGQENHAPATPPPGGHPASHPEGHPASHPEGHPASHPEGHPASHPEGHPASHPERHPASPGDQPTTLSFDPVRSSRVRLDMTSAAPGTGAGFLQIVELRVLSGGTAVT